MILLTAIIITRPQELYQPPERPKHEHVETIRQAILLNTECPPKGGYNPPRSYIAIQFLDTQDVESIEVSYKDCIAWKYFVNQMVNVFFHDGVRYRIEPVKEAPLTLSL